MPERHTGLKGYLGEWIVETWLKFVQYPGHQIWAQVRPHNLDAHGGPYLDFGVADENAIANVYEVKTQDYRLDDKAGGSKLNKALKYVWDLIDGQNGQRFRAGQDLLVVQDGPTLPTSPQFNAWLVLMVPPTDTVIATYAAQRDRILYLRDLLRELQQHLGDDRLSEMAKQRFAEDLPVVIANIEKPTSWPADKHGILPKFQPRTK